MSSRATRRRSSSAASASSIPQKDVFSNSSHKQKLTTLSTTSARAKTFVVESEDHTLGNALRHAVMRDPEVEFCGFTVPHPMEDVIHLRIQTSEATTANDALRRGLEALVAVCEVVEDRFAEAVER